jgi:SNF2 family DNA or RNA helicase
VKKGSQKKEAIPAGAFILKDISFNDITYGTLLKVADATVIQQAPGNASVVQADTMEIDACAFICNYGFREEHNVTLVQTATNMVMTCTCGDTHVKMCTHEGFVLYHVLENNHYRLFFDTPARKKFLANHALSFGIISEDLIARSFQVYFENNETKIQNTQKALIGLSSDKKAELIAKLKPIPFDPDRLIATNNYSFLVFHSNNYTKECVIKFVKSEQTKTGAIKTPIEVQNALDEVINQTEIIGVKAFAALGILQQEYRQKSAHPKDQEEAYRREIKLILAVLPLFSIYPVYETIDKTLGLKAANFRPVTIEVTPVEIELQVTQKDEFYEITGAVEIDNKHISFAAINIAYTHFIRRGDTLYLVKDWTHMRTINYFLLHHAKLIIHQSQFEEFQQEFLSPLENNARINYSFVKKATRALIKQTDLAVVNAKRIYLSNSDHFITITPIIQYGSVEIPILSKRKIVTIDQTGTSFEIPRDEEQEIDLLGRVLREHTDFEAQMGGDFFYLHKQRFLENDWFLNAFEHWTAVGIELLGFQEITKLKLQPTKMKISIQLISGIDWFETKAQITVGKTTVRLKEIQKSVVKRSRYVALGDGTFGLLPEQWLNRFARFFDQGEFIEEAFRIPKTAYQFIDDWFDIAELDQTVREQITELKAKINNFDTIPTIPLPKLLKATLRDYQKDGYDWLHFLRDFGFGGILADDMGLGKTVQVLAFLSKLAEKNPAGMYLIVVPTSLVFNWKNEIEKFTPHLEVFENYGKNRVKTVSAFDDKQIILTTYGALMSDIKYFKAIDFSCVILDEGQAIKNPDAKRYKMVRLLQAQQRIVLTGTPIENNTLDIFSLLTFCNPGIFGTLKSFRDHFAYPIDKFQDSQRVRELQQKIRPYLLRRTKKQVAKELPEKTEMVIYCEMDHEQKRVYDVYKEELKNYLLKQRTLDDGENSLHVLQALTKLRQICNSPALLNDRGVSYGDQSAKISVLLEQIEEKIGAHKILVFSQFVTMLDLVKTALIERGIAFSYLTGQTKNRQEAVDSFQNDSSKRVFLISLKAGGMGLNLTEADYVYLIDPWWNPAVENQAIDRAYRIGQTKHVVAIRLITPNSIEENIQLLQARKHDLVADLVHTDTSLLKKLTKKELLDLL